MNKKESLEDLLTEQENSESKIESVNEGLEEPKELTEEEEREIKIQKLKQSHLLFNTKKNFGRNYKDKRKRKNKIIKASRKKNRK